MAKSKQLVCLDERCNDILKDESNKSGFIRKAIIFYENSTKKVETDKAPETTEDFEVKIIG